MFIIAQREGFVEVMNAARQRLFCHVSVEKAEARLKADWSRDAAAVFANPANAPEIQIVVEGSKSNV